MAYLNALLFTLIAAEVATAASLQQVHFPTPGLEGYETRVLGLLAGDGETLRGFEATITGPMHQVNPAGIPTVLQDSNAIFPFFGVEPVQDSQFLFVKDEVLAFGDEESEELLKAAVGGLPSGLPNPTPVVQVVTDRPGDVHVSMVIDNGPSLTFFRGTLSNCFLTEFFEASYSVEPIASDSGSGLTTFLVTLDLLSNDGGVSVFADFSGRLSQSEDAGTTFQSDLDVAERPSDSHFLFDREGLLIPIEEDSDDSLMAAFNVSVGDSWDAQIPLAKIVTDDPTSIQFDLFVGGCGVEYEFSGFLIPEPTTAVLLVCLVGVVASAKRPF